MKTKSLAFAALAVAVGISSWSAGGATANTDASPAVTTAPESASEMQEAKSAYREPPTTVYVSKSFGEPAPAARARPAAPAPAPTFKTGIGPAMMFQLRDNAGG